MKRFGQFLREREELNTEDDPLMALFRIVVKDHKPEVLAFLDDLAVSDHRLREKLDAYKVKASKQDDKLPASGPNSDMDEIVPATADGVGGTEQD